MLAKLMKKMLVWLMTVTMTVAPWFGVEFTDKYEPGSFEEIGVEEKAENAVRIMSFNIRFDDVNGVKRKFRLSLVPLKILEANPDSVGLQEATEEWRAFLRLVLPEYTMVGVGRDGHDRGEAAAILYNHKKYKCLDSGTFWLSETPEKVSTSWGERHKRTCTWVLLENKKTGERFVHANSHLDYEFSEANKGEANVICTFLQEKFPEEKLFFTADLNKTETAASYKQLTSIMQDARHTAPDSKGTSFTFHDGKPWGTHTSRIDYILYRGAEPTAFRVVTEGINGRLVSDHFPLYADFLL